MKNVPSSWDRMTAHAKACYLVDTHRAKDYGEARKMLWNDAKATAKAKTMPTASKAPFWWNEGSMA